ncbi:S41 family peptidase [Metamycoplasma equirhinis]|uniref:S41 family peptidase n=1 Tax=Metamycoplasma equirhinis TaxID=92402 RepID=UPI003594908C
MKISKRKKFLISMGTFMSISPVAIIAVSCDTTAQKQLKEVESKLKNLTKELEETKKALATEEKKSTDTSAELEAKKQELANKIKELENKTKELENAKKGILPKSEPKNDEEVSITSREYDIINLHPDYEIKSDSKLRTYTTDKKPDVLYVDIDEAIEDFKGYFDDLKQNLDITIDEQNNQKIYQFKKWGQEYKTEYQITVNWESDYIHTTTSNIFWFLLDHSKRKTRPGGFSSYNSSKSFNQNDDKKGVLYKLGKYGFDILYKDGKVLLPFSIFNTIFMSQNFVNTYFNGEKIVTVAGGIGVSAKSPNANEKVRKSNLQTKIQTTNQRKLNYNHLTFVMDHFYGLKDYKHIKSFDEYITAEGLKEKILSTDPKIYNQAYIDLFHKKLNELHTRMNSFSYYEKDEKVAIPTDFSARGEFYKKFYTQREELTKKFEAKYGAIKDLPAEKYIRYHGNTAIVTLFGFKDGTDEQKKSPDAWKHDTYFLMRKLMRELKKRPEIKNIVLDLAINGGGSVSSMCSVMGFMTDEPILNREYDILNRRHDLSAYDVDTDGVNGSAFDAYTQYNWNILVGINTFSAANQLTSIVKEMGIAKIIGQKTGGGMSAIMANVLSDGTTITISGPNNAVFGPQKDPIEGGVEPDIKLDYEHFYDEAKIDEIIKTIEPTEAQKKSELLKSIFNKLNILEANGHKDTQHHIDFKNLNTQKSFNELKKDVDALEAKIWANSIFIDAKLNSLESAIKALIKEYDKLIGKVTDPAKKTELESQKTNLDTKLLTTKAAKTKENLIELEKLFAKLEIELIKLEN